MRVPAITLSFILFCSTLICISGIRLARRETVERVPVDRTLYREFGNEMHAEMGRLDDLYLAHLERIAVSIQLDYPAAVREWLQTVHGVRQCTIFQAETPKRAVSIRLPGPTSPDPVLMEDGASPPPRPMIGLPIREVFYEAPEAPRRGWKGDRNSEYAAFWLRRSEPESSRLVVLTVARKEIAGRMHQSLARWLTGPYAALRAGGDAHAIEGPGGLLGGLSQPPPGAGAPDFVLPLQCRFGTWQIVAWDRFVTRHHDDPATLAVSLTLAGLLTLTGVMLFRHQRRTYRLAEERVTFVNRVSHELGTPLTNILLNLDLADDSLDDDRKQTRVRIQLVRDEAHRLGRLVCNVLTFSKSARGVLKAHPQPCIPDAVIDQTLEHFAITLARRGIVVERESGAGESVLLDGDALAQIVSNLLSNVEKYASDGKWTKVTSTLSKGELTVAIEDRGPGISEADSSRIFAPFERVSSRINEGATGAGLGLAIASDLAHTLSGHLRLVALEVGSRFELRIPVAQPPTLPVKNLTGTAL